MYSTLEQIALAEFNDLVISTAQLGRRAGITLKLRLHFRDGTFMDVWFSPDGNRYSYHWEQRAKRGLIYRHDNAPDHPEIPTYPKHFHNGSEDRIEESYLPDDPAEALRYFLKFARTQLDDLGD
ncbi:MAG: toxin-antitoxin system TumE family protein [Anaerolineales bacterium]